LIVLVGRRDRTKELEILVLRHELSILRRQVNRLPFDLHDRVLLAAFSRILRRRSWERLPGAAATLLRWQRRLVAGRWPCPHRRPGQPPISRDVRELILRLARENPSWSYQRIVGELRKLDMTVSATSVCKILPAAGLPPHRSATGNRGAASCRQTRTRSSRASSPPCWRRNARQLL
jgi:hypothetical protein